MSNIEATNLENNLKLFRGSIYRLENLDYESVICLYLLLTRLGLKQPHDTFLNFSIRMFILRVEGER